METHLSDNEGTKPDAILSIVSTHVAENDIVAIDASTEAVNLLREQMHHIKNSTG